MKLSVKGLALSLGILEGLGILILALVAQYSGYGSGLVNAVGTVYIGLDASLGGAVIGAIWGFVDGLIGGALVAWLYNKLS